MRACFPVLAALLAVPGAAAETLAELNFAAEGQPLFGAGGAETFGATRQVELGTVATLGFGSTADSGSVAATVEAEVTATWSEAVAAGEGLEVTLVLDRLRAAFTTELNAQAQAELDLLPLFERVDPPPVTVIEREYQLTAEAAEVVPLGGTVSADDRVAMVGAPVPGLPAVAIESRVTLDASQTSRLELQDIAGTLRATHESGAVVEAPFSLAAPEPLTLPLDLPGEWRLEFVAAEAITGFASEFGLAATGTVGAAIGIGCGDFATDDDNGRLCGGDTAATGATPPLTLLATPPAPLGFAPLSVLLGTVRVS